MLLGMDSFDGYTSSTDMGKKWLAASGTITASVGRNGTSGLRIGGGANPIWAIGTQTEVVTGFSCQINTALGSSTSICELRNGTSQQLELRVTTDYKLQVTRGGAGTILATSTTALLTLAVTAHIQFKALLHTSSGGNFHVKVNGVTVSWDSANTGRTTAASPGTADRLYITGHGTGSGSTVIDDFWVCDTSGSLNNDFLGDCRVECIRPNAAGDTTQWDRNTGSTNYEAVDDTAPDGDSTYVYTGVDGEIDLYNFGSLVSTSGLVLALQTIIYARKDDAGARKLSTLLKSGGTEYPTDTSLEVSLNDDYNMIINRFEENPVTTDAWTISEVNAAQFGFKLTD